MKNILITGGAGFIGSSLALKLINKGYHIRVLDNLSSQIHGSNAIETSPLYKQIVNKAEFLKGSVTNYKDFANAIKDQNAIIHLAAETGTGQSMYKIKRYSDVNIGGTALLLDLLTNRKHQVKKVLIASSRAVYGEGKYECKTHGIVYPNTRNVAYLINRDYECKCPVCKSSLKCLPTSEDSKLNPSSIYGITKQNQEQFTMTVCPSIGISPVIFRFQNVYGPGQSLSNPYTGILSIFTTQIKNGNNISIFEDGLESRDFIYINDVVDAIVLGLENENANGEIFNVGTGNSVTVIEIAKILMKYYSQNVGLEMLGNFRLGDIRHNFSDTTNISSKLGFRPNFSFDKGIQSFVQWVNNQNIQEDNFTKSIKEMENKGLFITTLNRNV
jgi:dTDP-L-rhamnose 4-epimerase